MRAILSIWMQPVYACLNKKDYIHLGFLLLLLPAGAALLPNLSGHFQLQSTLIAAGLGLFAAMIIIIFLWFALLIAYGAQQNSLSNLILIPHFKRRMMAAFGIQLVILSILASVLFSFRSEISIYWIWLNIVLVMLLCISSIRNVYIFPVALVGGALFLRLIEAIPSGLSGVIKVETANAWLCVAAGIFSIYVGLNWIWSIDKQRIQKQKKEIDQVIALTERGEYQVNQSPLSWLNVYPQQLQALADLGSKRNALIPYILGPNAHWSACNANIAGLALLIFLSYAWTIWMKTSSLGHPSDYLPALYFCFCISYSLILANLRMSVYSSRIGQGLLILSPGVQSQTELSRILLRFMMSRLLTFWVLLFISTVALCECTTIPNWARTLAYLLCFCLLPFTICLVQDHAKTRNSQHTGLGLISLLCLLFSIAGFVVVDILHLVSIVTPCTILLIVSIFFIAKNWKKRLQQKAVFPAGRAV